MKAPNPFGRFLLLDRINVGGMAEVFLAKTFGVEGFERLLAVKRILPNMADDDEFINMFVDEARIAVQLSHSNIVQIYELGKFENQYYIAMEYVSGKDLRQVLDVFRKADKRLPITAAAFIASKICEGLDYAHRKLDPSGRPLSLIHRDVSPQNILVSFEGAVKVTDFGIAKAEDRASKTQAGVLKGKFGYMSPEQVRGLEIDQRSDIFALGILLYEMVTGKRLFIGESDFSTLEKVRNAEVPSPSEVNPAVPPALEQVMLKALARERDQRYTYASDLHDDLQQFLIEEQTIYNSKKLAALLAQEFGPDIERERGRLEDAMHAKAPQTPEAISGMHEMKKAAHITGEHSRDNLRAEKTMIFGALEAAEDWNAPTRVAPDASVSTPRITLETKMPVHNAPLPVPRRARLLAAREHARKNAGWLIVGCAVVVSLVILVAVLAGMRSSGTGTLVVRSTPADAEVFLDGTQVANGTPYTNDKVPVGRHVLIIRSRGYLDKAFSIDLAGGGTVPVSAKLEAVPDLRKPRSARGEKHTLNIRSEPPGAAVKSDGVQKGVTPLSYELLDTASVTLEFSLVGYAPHEETVVFREDEGEKLLTVSLEPATNPKNANMTRLAILSIPEGATVLIDGVRIGPTPQELTGLDARRTYAVQLVREGYKDAERQVRFDVKKDVVLTITMEKRAPKSKRDPAQKSPGAGAPVAGGGGKCDGTGAKLSVNAKGVAGCAVMVGKVDLGYAPVWRKDAPVGRCDIVVTCGDGKRFTTTRPLRAGADEKLIIESSMWK